mmetsp:Transcript_134800/g.375683  ORF Transcript_134800/g.375683 Transcript_134800/m.375683 type:complete len:213 (+) Transcript_134800:686-1324(+)
MPDCQLLSATCGRSMPRSSSKERLPAGSSCQQPGPLSPRAPRPTAWWLCLALRRYEKARLSGKGRIRTARSVAAESKTCCMRTTWQSPSSPSTAGSRLFGQASHRTSWPGMAMTYLYSTPSSKRLVDLARHIGYSFAPVSRRKPRVGSQRPSDSQEPTTRTSAPKGVWHRTWKMASTVSRMPPSPATGPRAECPSQAWWVCLTRGSQCKIKD